VIYREAGQFQSTYSADQAIFPIVQDKVVVALAVAAAFLLPTTMASDYWLQAVLIPFLVYALAAIGLNLLTGYAGQISLGTGGFMAVGAYSAFKLATEFPRLNIIAVFVLAGVIAAGVGVLFGIPSLRIKGFYLAVATLAAQFFLQWSFNRVPWLYNYNVSGAIEAPLRTLFGIPIIGPNATAQTRYLVVLTLVILLTWTASNLVHGRIGRMWMAIRDMDIAAELMGIRLLRTKLLAFAVSSYYCGVAGALLVFLWYGGAEYDVFNINQSFFILFMVIIGGLGSLIGSFFGAALIYIMPIGLGIMLPAALGPFGITVHAATIEHLRFMIVGALIIFFLIVEPHGLARLWQIGKQKLRVWPFPY
jgi:branched-chain amino acid transport system permease protein